MAETGGEAALARIDTRDATPWTTYIVAFLAPAAIVYTAFSIYPLIDTIRLSLYTADSHGSVHFTGLGNFVTLLDRPALGGAVLERLRQQSDLLRDPHDRAELDRPGARRAAQPAGALPGAASIAPLIFLPTMLSVVIIGFIWQLILSPLWGIAEGFLNVFGLGGLFAPWLGLESTALVTISLISVWQFVGIPMMLIYAALLNIPDDLVDAATRRRRQPVARLLVDQAAADPADARARRRSSPSSATSTPST